MNWKLCCAPAVKTHKPIWCAISFLNECMPFERQGEQLGLGHAGFYAERAVGVEPFVLLLAYDFLPD